MLGGNGALKDGSSLQSYLSALAAPLLPSAPQEANADGSRAGAVSSDPLGVYLLQGWAGRKSATPPMPRSPPSGEELLRTLKEKPEIFLAAARQ